MANVVGGGGVVLRLDALQPHRRRLFTPQVLRRLVDVRIVLRLGADHRPGRRPSAARTAVVPGRSAAAAAAATADGRRRLQRHRIAVLEQCVRRRRGGSGGELIELEVGLPAAQRRAAWGRRHRPHLAHVVELTAAVVAVAVVTVPEFSSVDEYARRRRRRKAVVRRPVRLDDGAYDRYLSVDVDRVARPGTERHRRGAGRRQVAARLLLRRTGERRLTVVVLRLLLLAVVRRFANQNRNRLVIDGRSTCLYPECYFKICLCNIM